LIKDKDEQELLAFVVDNLEKREPFYSKAKVIFETNNLITREDVTEYIRQLISIL
jgi:shikimate kinase